MVQDFPSTVCGDGVGIVGSIALPQYPRFFGVGTCLWLEVENTLELAGRPELPELGNCLTGSQPLPFRHLGLMISIGKVGMTSSIGYCWLFASEG